MIIKCTYRCNNCGTPHIHGKNHCIIKVCYDRVQSEDVCDDSNYLSCPYSEVATAEFKLIKKVETK